MNLYVYNYSHLYMHECMTVILTVKLSDTFVGLMKDGFIWFNTVPFSRETNNSSSVCFYFFN